MKHDECKVMILRIVRLLAPPVFKTSEIDLFFETSSYTKIHSDSDNIFFFPIWGQGGITLM